MLSPNRKIFYGAEKCNGRIMKTVTNTPSAATSLAAVGIFNCQEAFNTVKSNNITDDNATPSAVNLTVDKTTAENKSLEKNILFDLISDTSKIAQYFPLMSSRSQQQLRPTEENNCMNDSIYDRDRKSKNNNVNSYSNRRLSRSFDLPLLEKDTIKHKFSSKKALTISHQSNNIVNDVEDKFDNSLREKYHPIASDKPSAKILARQKSNNGNTIELTPCYDTVKIEATKNNPNEDFGKVIVKNSMEQKLLDENLNENVENHYGNPPYSQLISTRTCETAYKNPLSTQWLSSSTNNSNLQMNSNYETHKSSHKVFASQQQRPRRKLPSTEHIEQQEAAEAATAAAALLQQKQQQEKRFSSPTINSTTVMPFDNTSYAIAAVSVAHRKAATQAQQHRIPRIEQPLEAADESMMMGENGERNYFTRRRISFLTRSTAIDAWPQATRKQTSSPLPQENQRLYSRNHPLSKSWNVNECYQSLPPPPMVLSSNLATLNRVPSNQSSTNLAFPLSPSNMATSNLEPINLVLDDEQGLYPGWHQYGAQTTIMPICPPISSMHLETSPSSAFKHVVINNEHQHRILVADNKTIANYFTQQQKEQKQQQHYYNIEQEQRGQRGQQINDSVRLSTIANLAKNSLLKPNQLGLVRRAHSATDDRHDNNDAYCAYQTTNAPSSSHYSASFLVAEGRSSSEDTTVAQLHRQAAIQQHGTVAKNYDQPDGQSQYDNEFALERISKKPRTLQKLRQRQWSSQRCRAKPLHDYGNDKDSTNYYDNQNSTSDSFDTLRTNAVENLMRSFCPPITIRPQFIANYSAESFESNDTSATRWQTLRTMSMMTRQSAIEQVPEVRNGSKPTEKSTAAARMMASLESASSEYITEKLGSTNYKRPLNPLVTTIVSSFDSSATDRSIEEANIISSNDEVLVNDQKNFVRAEYNNENIEKIERDYCVDRMSDRLFQEFTRNQCYDELSNTSGFEFNKYNLHERQSKYNMNEDKEKSVKGEYAYMEASDQLINRNDDTHYHNINAKHKNRQKAQSMDQHYLNKKNYQNRTFTACDDYN